MLKHLAIIPDGNRRWARDRGLPTLEGHRRGYDAFKTVGLAALERGIEQVSIWGFSTENWKRSEEEVGYLMDLFLRIFTKEVDFFLKHGVRVKVIGSRDGLPGALVRAIAGAEERTAGGARGPLNICLNYGGRAEITDGVKRMLADGIEPDAVDEAAVREHLWTADLPDPDMIIRTSGEKRLSGFMSWAGAYAELFFIDKHWPDFSEEDLDAAIAEFSGRERRFGK